MPAFLIILLALLFLTFAYSAESWNGDKRMTQLETRISQALSQTEGAGNVRVVIRTVKPAQQSKAMTGYNTQDEIPCGAVAVVQGGSDPLVRLKLTNALCALLGLHASQVEIVGMNEGNVDR